MTIRFAGIGSACVGQNTMHYGHHMTVFVVDAYDLVRAFRRIRTWLKRAPIPGPEETDGNFPDVRIVVELALFEPDVIDLLIGEKVDHIFLGGLYGLLHVHFIVPSQKWDLTS